MTPHDRLQRRARLLITDLIRDVHRALDDVQRTIAEQRLNDALHIQTLAHCNDRRAMRALISMTTEY